MQMEPSEGTLYKTPLIIFLQMYEVSLTFKNSLTLSPLALLIALRGRRTRKTRNIFTTDIAPWLKNIHIF